MDVNRELQKLAKQNQEVHELADHIEMVHERELPFTPGYYTTRQLQRIHKWMHDARDWNHNHEEKS